MRAASNLALAPLLSLALAVACSESVPDGPADPITGADGGAADAAAPPPLGEPAAACADSLEAVYESPGALPEPTPALRGEIVRCAKDRPLTRDDLTRTLAEAGYAGPAPRTGARTYRVLYRTERGDAKGSAGTSSALLLVPDEPRAERLPPVVVSRGSRGQGPECTASRRVMGKDGVDDDYRSLAFPFVAAGYAVLVPDLAGYANYGAPRNPPSAYAAAKDVGQSTLDGARALRRLYPALGEETVLVGHSQGGHTALSALALVDSYGASGDKVKVAGAAVFAPLWLSQRAWGAALLRDAAVLLDVTIASAPTVAAVSVWYHYTQAELIDGPGEGLKLFAADKRPLIKKFVEEQCWAASYPALAAAATYIDELFDPTFVESVSYTAAGTGACNDATCEKWMARYAEDRPHLTGSAASTPLLILYGGKDASISPDRMTCAMDRLRGDATKASVCYRPGSTHGGIVDDASETALAWVGARTLGEPEPAPCAAIGSFSIAGAACPKTPPND